MHATLRIPVILASITMLVLSSVALAPGGAAQEATEEEALVDITNWNIGDFWYYKKTTGPGDGSNAEGTWKFRVQSVEQVELSQWSDSPYWGHSEPMKKHTAYRVATWLNQTVDSGYGTGILRQETDNYHRTDDLALAHQESWNDYKFEDPTANQKSGRLVDYFPPRISIQYPFAVGDKWQVDSMRLSKEKNCEPYEGGPPCDRIQHPYLDVYEVLRKEQLTLTVNGEERTFDTYVIKIVDMRQWDDPNRPEEKRYQIWWYAPEVCRWVQEEAYKSTGELRWRITLTDYKCSARETPNPAYRESLYSFENFSSIRFDGKLAPKTKLRDFEDLARGGTKGGEDGNFQLGRLAPGVELFGVLGALFVAAMWANRRRDA